MRLERVVSAVPGARLHGPPNAGTLEISDVVQDHRHLGDSTLESRILFAARGSVSESDARRRAAAAADRARQAVANGAVALMADHLPDGLPSELPVIVVPDVLASVGPVAAAVHGNPSAKLKVMAVTGTDGKTTTSYMAAAAVRRGANVGVGLLSTIERMSSGVMERAGLTTAEAPDLQRYFRRMVDGGDRAAVVETSSIALVQGRLRGTHVDIAAFTNLTEEHLDYHQTMERYFEAKRLLFAGDYASIAVINIDDHYGARMAREAHEAGLDVRTVSAAGQSAFAEVLAVNPDQTGHSRVQAVLNGEVVEFTVQLPGRHNIENALCAMAVAVSAGADVAGAAEGLSSVQGVPGRMQCVPNGRHIHAFVDYAHTPAGLATAISAARGVAPRGRVIVVAGCGGGRYADKRQLMGLTVARLADVFIATNDNPRDENPNTILDQMLSSPDLPRNRFQLIIEPDRRAAIERAVSEATPGDIVLVTGKGHETVQITGSRHEPFEDHAVLSATFAGLAVA